MSTLLYSLWGRQKKEGEDDEYIFHKVSYKWIRKTQVIPECVVFYKNVGILLGKIQFV
jgi:hypothetical protein